MEKLDKSVKLPALKGGASETTLRGLHPLDPRTVFISAINVGVFCGNFHKSIPLTLILTGL
jgi:hypothetical protein